MVRHAKASTVDGRRVAPPTGCGSTVTDDGVGLRPDGRRSGLVNLAERAGQLGGALRRRPRPAGDGTRLVWDVPLG